MSRRDDDGAAPRTGDAGGWGRLVLGLVVVYALFEGVARSLGSVRGEHGLVVAAVVVGALLAVERVAFGVPIAASIRDLGLGAPARRGLAAAVVVVALLLAVLPAYGWICGASWSMVPGWLGLLPGLLAQGGVAEEALFRGYLFRRLRRDRSFWRATLVSSGPFVLVHLALFATLPWPIALVSLLLAALISLPQAHLFEIGGRSIWAPALVHWAVQGAIKVVEIEPAGATFPIVWMLACAVIPYLVFVVRRDPAGGSPRASVRAQVRSPARRA